MSLGSTWSLPDEETFMESEKDLLDDISMSLGGRVAEEIVYGTMYTGAFGDLQRVTRVARAMVCEYGMSEKLGTLALGRRSKNPFLGRDAFEDRDYSEDVAKEIDDEVRRIVNQCYVRAKDILTTHREQLDNVVQVLLERETIGREEFLAIMEGRPLPEMVSEDEPPTGTTADVPEDAKSSNRVPAPPKFEPGPA
jgi:cell division protease FtsH